ncbi:hypothetical protein PAXRUDRAFT_831973, partial [Paxillus rubicundulus Ve08.2h10]
MPACNDPYPAAQRQQIWKALSNLILNFSLCVAAVMAESTVEGSLEKARWTPAKVTALIDYLHDHCVEHGEAGNFKETTYNAAATTLRPLYNGIGTIKTGKMVGSKWATVLKATY